MFSIEGKVALVTGGASGIGLATVKKLLENGAKGVAIADVNDKLGKTELGNLRTHFGHKKIIFIHTDVSKKSSFEDAFKQTLAAFNNIDILVNNAGIFDDIDYEREIAVNFTGVVHGVVLGIQKYISTYKSGSEGVIINTASIAGTQVYPSSPIYASTKDAIISLTMALGYKAQYDKTKVRVVAVAPGFTNTNIVTSVEDRTFNKTCSDMMVQDIQKLQSPQTADFVGEKMIEIITSKPSGSVWIAENEENLKEHIRPVPLYEYV